MASRWWGRNRSGCTEGCCAYKAFFTSNCGYTENMKWLKTAVVMNLILFLIYLLTSIRISEQFNRLNLAYTPPSWKSPYLLTFGMFSFLSFVAWIYFRGQMKVRKEKNTPLIKVAAGVLSVPWLYVLLSHGVYWVILFIISVFGNIKTLPVGN